MTNRNFGTKLLLFSSTMFASGTFANAAVNVKDGNFTTTVTDLELPGSAVQIRRHYDSRSLVNGIFGFGWCSEIEEALEFKRDGKIEIRGCGSEKTKIFVKEERDPKDPKLEAYRNMDSPTDRILLRAGLYLRQQTGATIRTYDSRGRLLTWPLPNGQMALLSYDRSGQLAYLKTPDSKTIQVRIDPRSKKVKRIADERTEVTYAFNGENLANAARSTGTIEKYEYDALHNLTRIERPNGTIESIWYESDRDRVKAYKGSDNCLETLSYAPFEPNRLRQTVELKRQCGSRDPDSTQFEFWFGTRADGKTFLARQRTLTRTEARDVRFHPTLGKPIRTEDKHRIVTYGYDLEGRLSILKDSNGRSLLLEYDSSGRLTDVSTNGRKLLRLFYTEISTTPYRLEVTGAGGLALGQSKPFQVETERRTQAAAAMRAVVETLSSPAAI